MNNNLIIGSHVGFSNNKQLLGSVEEALKYIDIADNIDEMIDSFLSAKEPFIILCRTE